MSDHMMGEILTKVPRRWARMFGKSMSVSAVWCELDSARESSRVILRAEGGGGGGRYSVTTCAEEVSRWELEDGRFRRPWI